MVEVYSTNVEDQKQADFLLQQLVRVFPAYKINFDLEDRDNILRVESDWETMEVFQVIALLKDFGFTAQVLPDIPEGSKESTYRKTSTN